ncbi:MAG: hypothetical protein GF400_00520 [Candidatus Eisenbacteria bacterium]|nr:hypothetical protein [Candidatus Eisenbacteria bacterium]
MREQLELLIELSRIDEGLQELELERESLPSEIAKLEARKQDLRDSIAEREKQLEETARERALQERELEKLSSRLEAEKARRLEIKTNEEYAALSLEIEQTSTRISEAEDTILRALETAEQASSGLAEARREADREIADLDASAAELAAELGRLDDALAVKRDERLRLSKRIDGGVLGRYERILLSKGDSAVAVVSDGICSGCRIKLPPQTVIEVRRRDELIECQSCGRILLWKPEGALG